jgi:hypothetical protein
MIPPQAAGTPDITERLKNCAENTVWGGDLMREAAAEIRLLRGARWQPKMHGNDKPGRRAASHGTSTAVIGPMRWPRWCDAACPRKK